MAAGTLGPAFLPAAGLHVPLQLSSANALGLECWCMFLVLSRVIKVCCAVACKLLLHIHTMPLNCLSMPCLLLSPLALSVFSSGAAQAGVGAGSGAGGASAAGEIFVVCMGYVLVFLCTGSIVSEDHLSVAQNASATVTTNLPKDCSR